MANRRTTIQGIGPGVRVGGPPVTSEADHFFTCEACGQSVDMRELSQMFHHDEPGHEPLQNDDEARGG